MLREIEGRVICLPLIFERDRLVLERDTRNVFPVEKIGRMKAWMLKFAFCLANQMIDLRSRDARHFKFDGGQTARPNR
jgi:hypothetical protein